MHGGIDLGEEAGADLGHGAPRAARRAPPSSGRASPASTERRPIIARMISAVNTLPRAASISLETRKNNASVSNIRPSRSKTTARISWKVSRLDPIAEWPNGPGTLSSRRGDGGHGGALSAIPRAHHARDSQCDPSRLPAVSTPSPRPPGTTGADALGEQGLLVEASLGDRAGWGGSRTRRRGRDGPRPRRPGAG